MLRIDKYVCMFLGSVRTQLWMPRSSCDEPMQLSSKSGNTTASQRWSLKLRTRTCCKLSNTSAVRQCNNHNNDIQNWHIEMWHKPTPLEFVTL